MSQMFQQTIRIICENIVFSVKFQKIIQAAEKYKPPSTRSHPYSYNWCMIYCQPNSEDDILGFAH